MAASLSYLVLQSALPQHIELLLAQEDWAALAQELANGLEPNLSAHGGLSLFELVVSAAPREEAGPAQLPIFLLNALIEGGLKRGVLIPGEGLTAISVACEYGQWGWVERLIEKGFLIETEECPALACLELGRASRQEQLEDELMEDGGDDEEEPLDHSEYQKRLLLCQEVALGKMQQEVASMKKCIALLRKEGAQIDASLADTHPESALILQGHRAGFSPLLDAILRGDATLCSLLIEHGADLNSTFVKKSEDHGLVSRPLDAAINKRNTGVFLDLVAAGALIRADPTLPAPVQDYMHPFLCAAQEPIDEVILNTVAACLTPDELLRHGGLAMHLAAQRGQVEVMKALEGYGVPLDIRSENGGYLPLHKAATAGQEKVIEFLLQRGQHLGCLSHTGVSAASLLMDHPHLMKKFQAESLIGNVRAFRPKK